MIEINIRSTDSTPSIPRNSASSPSTRTFQQFLETKKEEGFGLQDFLQHRYLQFYTAESLLGKAVNFLLLGGLGYFFTDRRMDQGGRLSNLKQLQTESEFYRLCTKTQRFYDQFQKKPSDHTYAAASQIFEDLHSIIQSEKDNEAHQLINDALNKQVGKNVAQSLLEHFARKELTRNEQFSIGNLITFYGPDYPRTLLEKAHQGYGNAGIGEDGSITLSDPKSIRMVFAQVLRATAGDCEENLNTYLMALSALDVKEVEQSEIDAYVEDANKRLLAAIESGNIDKSLLALVPEQQQQNLISLYKEYTQWSQKHRKAHSDYSMKEKRLENIKERSAPIIAKAEDREKELTFLEKDINNELQEEVNKSLQLLTESLNIDREMNFLKEDINELQEKVNKSLQLLTESLQSVELQEKTVSENILASRQATLRYINSDWRDTMSPEAKARAMSCLGITNKKAENPVTSIACNPNVNDSGSTTAVTQEDEFEKIDL